MPLTKKHSPEELADELRRRESQPPVEQLGLIQRWRRSRMSRELGRSDYTAVLRSYYGKSSARHS